MELDDVCRETELKTKIAQESVKMIYPTPSSEIVATAQCENLAASYVLPLQAARPHT